jgi:hypothetical protein
LVLKYILFWLGLSFKDFVFVKNFVCNLSLYEFMTQIFLVVSRGGVDSEINYPIDVKLTLVEVEDNLSKLNGH